MTVFDCFLFNDELDLLEFRLSYLNEVVDRFVIVEATTTFRGRSKPLHLTSNMDRFRPWQAKMDIFVVDDLPCGVPPFVVERKQHAALRLGLERAAADDLVIVGDTDEIPYASLVQRLSGVLGPPSRLVLSHASNYANHRLPAKWTDGPKVCRGADLDDPEMGVLLGDPDAEWSPGGGHLIESAGWHLSYLGGPARIAGKLAAYSHVEFDRPLFREARYLERCRAAGIDPLWREKLEVIYPNDFDDILAELYARAPELFSFEIRPSGWRWEGLYAYTRLRGQERLPIWAVRLLDSASPTALGVIAAPLVPARRLLGRASA